MAEFDNISMSAILYTATGQPTGNFTYNNGTQTFILTTGKAVIGPADKGATYPVPNNALTDGTSRHGQVSFRPFENEKR
jgi:hypothetical protein